MGFQSLLIESTLFGLVTHSSDRKIPAERFRIQAGI
jgi:hypothetical protein